MAAAPASPSSSPHRSSPTTPSLPPLPPPALPPRHQKLVRVKPGTGVEMPPRLARSLFYLQRETAEEGAGEFPGCPQIHHRGFEERETM